MKYYELADDDTYEPEWGYTPTNQYSKDDLVLLSADVLKNDDISFTLYNYGPDGELQKFYIELSEAEIESGLARIEGEKYNL